MSRRNQILVGVLVVQLLLAVVVFWPRGSKAGGGEAMLADLDQVIEITVQDNAGHSIVLTKLNGAWVLPEIDDYPVPADKVSALLEKLEAFTTSRLVTKTASSHRRLKVADDAFERRVRLKRQDGVVSTFYLGSSPNYGVIHIRLDKQNQVYMVSDLSLTDVGAQAAGWVDAVYLSIEREQVVELTLENANGEFVFTRSENASAGADDRIWSMAGLGEGETLSQNSVTALLNRVSTLRMIAPVGKQELPKYGLQYPRALVTVKTRDAEGNTHTVVLRVGAKDAESNQYTVIASTSPYYVRVAEYAVQDFIEKTHQDFIEPPPAAQ